MASSKKPTYKVEIKPVVERKRKSDLVLMWHSFVDVTAAICHELILTLLKLWHLTELWFSASDREKVLKWIAQHVPHAPEDFGHSWRDGVLLCSLLESLQPGCFPHLNKLDTNFGLNNVYHAFEVLEKQFGISPNVTVEELVTCSRGSDAKVFEMLNELKSRTEEKTLINNSGKKTKNSNDMKVISDADSCHAKGHGLVAGFLGRVSSFVVSCPSMNDIDVMIAIKGPSGFVYSERITNRSPRNKTCFNSCNAFETFESLPFTRSLSYSNYAESELEMDKHDAKDIPLEYRICEREINVGFVPQERGQHVITVLWHGRHINGSPYTINIEDTASRLGSKSELRHLRSALKPLNQPNSDSKVPKNTAVRFQEPEKHIVDQRGKVKSRKVIRYILNVEGQDLIVEGDRTDLLGPALLKIDYNSDGKSQLSRRNSWGFVGDTVRKRSRIRQFRLDLDELEGMGAQRRSSSFTLMSSDSECTKSKLLKSKITCEKSLDNEKENLSECYHARDSSVNFNSEHRSCSTTDNESISMSESIHSISQDVIEPTKACVKKSVESHNKCEQDSTQAKDDEVQLQEVDEIVFEKRNLPEVGEFSNYQEYLNSKTFVANSLPSITNRDALLNLKDNCECERVTQGISSGSIDCKTTSSVNIEEVRTIDSECKKETILGSPLETQVVSRINKQTSIQDIRSVIKQEILRFAMKRYMYKIHRHQQHYKKPPMAVKFDSKAQSFETFTPNFQSTPIDDFTAKKRKTINDPYVNKLKNTVKPSEISNDTFWQSKLTHNDGYELHFSNISKDVECKTIENIYDNNNGMQNVSDMESMKTKDIKTCEEKRHQFRTRNTKHQNIPGSGSSLSSEEHVEPQTHSNKHSVQHLVKSSQNPKPTWMSKNKIQPKKTNSAVSRQNTVQNQVRVWEKVFQNRVNYKIPKYRSSVKQAAGLVNFQSKLAFWENAYKADASCPDEPNRYSPPNFANNIVYDDLTRLEEGQNHLGIAYINPSHSPNQREDSNKFLKISPTKIPLSFSPKSKKRTSSDPGVIEASTWKIQDDTYEDMLDGTLSRSCSLESLEDDSSILPHSEDDILANEKHCTEDEYIDDEIADCAPMYWGGLGCVRRVEMLSGNDTDRLDLAEEQLCYPGQCTVFGIGVYYGFVAIKNKFQVLTAGAGSGNLSVSVHGSGKHAVTHVIVVYDRKDVYSVVYQVTRPGYYIICVKWMNESVPGSPFVCKVTY